MKKIIINFLGLLILFLLTATQVGVTPVNAQTGPCSSLQCQPPTSRSPLANGLCECVGGSSNNVFGTIQAPPGVAAYGSVTEGGLTLFISNIIRIGTVVAGVWVMINFILAGWKYVTSAGDSKAPAEAASLMTNSLIGLAIIVGAYTLAAIIGLVFFGDATYIIDPTLTGVS